MVGYLFPRLLFLGVALSLAGCGGANKDPYADKPVEELYNGAVDLLLDENFEKAAKQFEEVDRQHPYSVWATKAQLMSAYSQYQASNYADSILALDRFIQLHPGNRDIAYAYYLKALDYYVQITDVGRDQENTNQAFKSLEEVSRRFPDSKYARDARLKLDLARDHLAGKEMEIGRFYQKEHQYLAAISRFKRVLDQYQTTTHVPEALHRLTECYLELGLVEEAQRTAAVLGYNYPGTEWYKDSYNLVGGRGQAPGSATAAQTSKDGWIGRVLDWMF